MSPSWAYGRRVPTVTVEGTVSSRFSQRTLRISESALIPGPATDLPAAVSVETGAASESFEGQRVRVSGTIIGAPDQLTDGLGVTLDDGSGTIRAVVGPDAVDGQSLASGMIATISGPLGQRDSSGTGTAGYRVHVTLPGELELAPAPTPSPAPTPTPSPTPTPTATPDAHTEPEPEADRHPDAKPDTDRYSDADPDSDPDTHPIHRRPRHRRRHSPWRPSAPCRSAARPERPASSSRRTAGSARRRCSGSAMGAAASSSTSRRAPARTHGARDSMSPGSLRLHTANSRSARPRPTSTSSGPAACRPRPPSRPPVSPRRSKAASSPRPAA